MGLKSDVSSKKVNKYNKVKKGKHIIMEKLSHEVLIF